MTQPVVNIIDSPKMQKFQNSMSSCCVGRCSSDQHGKNAALPRQPSKALQAISSKFAKPSALTKRSNSLFARGLSRSADPSLLAPWQPSCVALDGATAE